MFSEVYWHRTVRSATSMLQRTIYELRDDTDILNALIESTETEFQSILCDSDQTGIANRLFGNSRQLYKSIYETNANTDGEVYCAALRHDFTGLMTASSRLATLLGVEPEDVIIDAAPQQLEVQFNMEVIDEKTGLIQALSEVSPVVKALATDQFDHYVKRLRVFVPIEHRAISVDRKAIIESLA